MASLDNGSSNPTRCSLRECHIESFDVEVTAGTDVVTAVITDPCNQVTECRMAKSILSDALSQWLVDEGVTITNPCKIGACCDGVYGADYVVATNSVSLVVTGTTPAGAVTYTVVPPFATVN